MAEPATRILAPRTGARRVRQRLRVALLALLTAGVLVVAMPVVLAGSAAPVLGHTQLLVSVPAAGQVVAVSPTQIALVFSEPIEDQYTSFDLLDSSGGTILAAAGTPDPNNPDVLTATLPAPLAEGTYTINWQAVSAADGHGTSGFFTFGVGPVNLTGQTQSATSTGSLHPGQDSAHAAAEIQGKTAGYGGVMAAFGLAVLALLVLLPGLGRVPRGTGYGIGVGLIVAAGGCLVLVVAGATGLTAGGAAPDYLRYATGSRAGVLLTARLVLGLVAGLVAIVMARQGRPSRAVLVGGLAAAAEIGLIAAGSHAAAFSSPLPVAVDIIHVGSASIWLGGIIALGALTDFGGRTRLAPEVLSGMVRRFSALALVSIALIAATGMYAAWIEIGDFTAIRSAYDLNLAIKVGVFILAVAVGAMNYLDGGTDRRWLGGLPKRLLLELCLAVAVVVIAANLTSGSPTGADRPLAIAPDSTAPATTQAIGLALEPARPGPNRYVVTLPAPPTTGTTVQLLLTRVDGGAGSATLALQPDPADATGRTEVADVADLAANSQWQATVVVSGPAGAELARERFAFAIDATGLSAGRATPPIDPIVVVALLLLLGAVSGTALTLAGRSLPRTLRETSQVAVLGGSLVGGILGIALLIAGPPR